MLHRVTRNIYKTLRLHHLFIRHKVYYNLQQSKQRRDMHAQVSVAAIYYTTRSNYKRSDVMGTTLRHWLPSSSWSLGSTSYATKGRVLYITHEEGRRSTLISLT